MEQMQKFLSALHAEVLGTEYEAIYYLAMMQYLIYGRVQEAAALHFESFDFEGNKIHVDKKVQWIRKAGMKNRIVDGSKSNGGKVIDMSAHAARLFREWTLKSGVRAGPLFLIKGAIIPYRSIEYRYSKALKRAGLPFKATHILRHAALTEYYEGCKDLLATARMAGHSDLGSTERYTKNRNETLAKNQRFMDEKLSSLFAGKS
jgi:integrase